MGYCILSNAQILRFTFEGTNLEDQNEVTIDSVWIQNKKNASDTVILGNELLINLTGITEKEPNPNHFISSYPNPFTGKINIFIQSAYQANLSLSAYSVDGRVISSWQGKLLTGENKFVFQSSVEGLIFIVACTNKYNLISRIICQEKDKQSSINYIGIDKANSFKIEKRKSALIGSGAFCFQLGDSLTYTAYHGNVPSIELKDIAEVRKNYICVFDFGDFFTTANFSSDTTTINQGDSVYFFDLSTNSPVSWFWTFGDGASSKDQNPLHEYHQPGQFSVSLLVKNKYNSDSLRLSNLITVNSLSPISDFSVYNNETQQGVENLFVDLSLNSPTEWLWDFGDNESSNLQNPFHRYTTQGTYTVILTVSNKYGSDTKTKTNYITVNLVDSVDFVKDFDGNTYKTVTIGTQTWMAENLKVTHYPWGKAIPLVKNDNEWASLSDNNTDEAYCYYNNDSTVSMGALYTYAAAKDACPAGWHLPTEREVMVTFPSDGEWTTLKNYISLNGYNGTEGKALKASSGWNSNGSGADIYSFSALPGGSRSYDLGKFSGVGFSGFWWSNTEFDSFLVVSELLTYNNNNMEHAGCPKSNGYSVRCIKDY